MAFRVEIAPCAVADLETVYRFIKQESPERAGEWLKRITDAILSLERHPTRCPRAKESSDLGRDVRVLIFGKSHSAYKIFFAFHPARSKEKIVRVFHVRHGARKQLLSDQLRTLINK